MKKYKIFQDNFDANIVESSPSTYVIFIKRKKEKQISLRLRPGQVL